MLAASWLAEFVLCAGVLSRLYGRLLSRIVRARTVVAWLEPRPPFNAVDQAARSCDAG
jgi:hypothetical protein